jgi:hypothetical protein
VRWQDVKNNFKGRRKQVRIKQNKSCVQLKEGINFITRKANEKGWRPQPVQKSLFALLFVDLLREKNIPAEKIKLKSTNYNTSDQGWTKEQTIFFGC